uniref:CMP-N-acetylneuraminate-beta-galactosamide-alpha-2,3-sialyltransferase 1 n=1 Tax=Sphaerodactylus townsendi TaxID=933632 RepID=A0ACB8FE95_9SAUR
MNFGNQRELPKYRDMGVNLDNAPRGGKACSTYIPVPRKIKVTKDKILVYHPIFIKYVYDNWLRHHGRYPSTGFLSVIFALHICDELDLYGFGADTKGNWHHYWENNPSAGAFRQTGVHDGDFESNVTLNLASAYKIRALERPPMDPRTATGVGISEQY